MLSADDPAKQLVPRCHQVQTTLSMGSGPSQANNSVETAVLSMRKRNVLLTKCQKKNHFQKCCLSRTFVHEINNDNSSASATNVYTGQRENSFDQEYFIDTVSALSSVSLLPGHAFAQILTGPNQTPVQFKLTLAVLLLQHSQFKSLNVKHPLEAPSHKLTAYTGAHAPCHWNGEAGMLP